MFDPILILQNVFGHQEFRGSQLEIIHRALSGQSSLVMMPTGMGKSICFQIPAIIFGQSRQPETQQACFGNQDSNSRPPLTLVLSPLIALMKDQVDGLVEKGISAAYVNSTLTKEERLRRYRQVADGEFALLYVTPERFRKADFFEVLRQREIVLLVVDEAHCVSEWGHDFRPEYSRVGEIRNQLGCPPTLAVTATATRHVRDDVVKQLGLDSAEVAVFDAGIDRPNLELEVVEVWDDQQKLEQITHLRNQQPGSGIVYFNLIRHLMEFSDILRSQRVDHLIYHGELPRRHRKELQDVFMNAPGQLILATNAFGMGIDKKDIRLVVHADLPGSMESYYQEIGRAGRDGLQSRCVLLYDERDLATQMQFLEWSNPSSEYYFRVHQLLENERERVNALGLEWLHEKLHFKQKHDRRLETVLAMFSRWGVIEGTIDSRSVSGRNENSSCRIDEVYPLPDAFSDHAMIEAKKKRDQMKLLAILQYVRCEGDRREFIREYFA